MSLADRYELEKARHRGVAGEGLGGMLLASSDANDGSHRASRDRRENAEEQRQENGAGTVECRRAFEVPQPPYEAPPKPQLGRCANVSDALSCPRNLWLRPRLVLNLNVAIGG
jgi:hypothetical protein